MACVRKHTLHLTFIFWATSLYLTACAHESYGKEMAFAADMQVRIDNVNSTTRLWTRNGKLRLVLPAGRSASSMLADYTRGKCWALFPAQAAYREFPTESLRDTVPHFFDPATSIEKTFVGYEPLDGHMTRIYKATVTSRTGKTWEGTLWETENNPGLPFRWHDAHRDVEAYWRNATWVEVPEQFFEIPDHFAPQGQPTRPPSRPKPKCLDRTAERGAAP